MSINEFSAVLKLLISNFVQLIEKNKSLQPQQAANLLYSSQLYSKLEQEDTKLWHLSIYALYDLLEEEITTGKITYPEEA
jgi:uncharacterized protein YaaR (DUF327 family)